MKLAYWPGCVSRGFTPELHGSMELVAESLEIELVTLDRANCCGAGVIAEHNQELADSLNARTFAMAQRVEGAAGMMNICSTCQGAQSECQERLDASSAYRAEVNTHLQPEQLSYDEMSDLVSRIAGRPRRLVHLPLPLVRSGLIGIRSLFGEAVFATWEEAELMEVSMLSERGTADAEELGVEPRRMGDVLEDDD